MSTVTNWRVLEHADCAGDIVVTIVGLTDDGYADLEISLIDLARVIADEVRT